MRTLLMKSKKLSENILKLIKTADDKKDKKKKEKEITTNQKIFKAIRDNMNEIVPKSSQK